MLQGGNKGGDGVPGSGAGVGMGRCPGRRYWTITALTVVELGFIITMVVEIRDPGSDR